MRAFIRFVKDHLHSWDEICLDDSKRYRQSVILFTFIVSLAFSVMNIYEASTTGAAMSAPTILLRLVTITLFCWQFFRRSYSQIIAMLFGLTSLVTIVHFVSIGEKSGIGFLWVYCLPIVSVMVGRPALTLLYNGFLVAILFVLLNTPLYERIPAEYDEFYRISFPLSVLAVVLFNYSADFVRMRTQKHLQIATEKLRNSVFSDPLTGVYNRRALTAHFGETAEKAHGLSFAMLDLDYFKNVNDTHGHEVGDRLLCHLVALVNHCIPPGAHLYRWGGEEFLLVLKFSDRGRLEQVLDDVRRLVAETPLEVDKGDGEAISIKMTVSIGGMCAAPDDPIAACIKTADEQMYRAKKAGRNRVMMPLRGEWGSCKDG